MKIKVFTEWIFPKASLLDVYMAVTAFVHTWSIPVFTGVTDVYSLHVLTFSFYKNIGKIES